MGRVRFRAPVQPGAAAAAALVCIAFSPALAEQSPAPEQVFITARPPDPVGNAAYSTSALDEQQLEISPELDTALRQVPGLSLFNRNSSLSTNQTGQGVSLRSIGTSGAGRALVTLDGVPQNDPFGGWVVWSSLPPEDIQGAEIVRGPGVTLETYLHFESSRWSDDLNTLPVGSAATVDVQADFHVFPMFDIYAAVDNVANVQVGTSRSADQVLSIEAPRLFRAGIRYTF